MKITDIVKDGDKLRIRVDVLPEHVFKLILSRIKDKEDLIQQLKAKVAPSLKDQTIQDENDLKYNDWIKDIVGDTIA